MIKIRSWVQDCRKLKKHDMAELPLGGGNMTHIPDPLVDNDASSDPFAPLAARLRPHNFDDYIGQEHLVGPDKPIRLAVERGTPISMILWGPPGVGKTTLAFIIASYSHAELEQISAINSGVADIRQAIERAQKRKNQNIRTILFVDEVHRFNKSQQDAFLPHIENGTIIFIGATTENPSFSVNRALLSRSRVYVLEPLNDHDLNKLLDLALTSPKGLQDRNLVLGDNVREALIDLAAGDGRQLLNLLEIAASEAIAQSDGSNLITYEVLQAISGRRLLRLDKSGDDFYDLLSAFHKSVRGSDPDAALYWYARMLEAGGDPVVIARRILAIATEDVGLADPAAMQVALNAWDIYHRVGASEGERAIAEAAVYMALAPKSNRLYLAFEEARRDARELPSFEVPKHIRNAPTALLKEIGNHEGYKYPHDFHGSYVPGECYFPEEMHGRRYYKPTVHGLEGNYTKCLNMFDYLASRVSPSDCRFPVGHDKAKQEELRRKYPKRFGQEKANPHH